MTGHPAQRLRFVDDIGVHDQDRLHPVVAEDHGKPVVEGVRLTLAADLPAQVDDVAGELGRLRQDHVRCLVGARVIDHEDPQRGTRVVKQHQPLDRGADHRCLVPGRYQDRGAGEYRRAPFVVQPPEVIRYQQELVIGD